MERIEGFEPVCVGGGVVVSLALRSPSSTGDSSRVWSVGVGDEPELIDFMSSMQMENLGRDFNSRWSILRRRCNCGLESSFSGCELASVAIDDAAAAAAVDGFNSASFDDRLTLSLNSSHQFRMITNQFMYMWIILSLNRNIINELKGPQ